VKKLVCFFGLVAAALLVFAIVSNQAEANKAIFVTGGDDEIEKAKAISLEILRNRAALRSIGNPDEYSIKRVEIDELKMAHTHVQQSIGGVPVWEGEAIVHLRPDGQLSDITDSLKEAVTIETKPTFTGGEQALAIARGIGHGRILRKLTDPPTIDLWIYRGDDRDHLAYRVIMPRIDGTAQTSVPVVFVDAHTGEKIFEYEKLQTGTGCDDQHEFVWQHVLYGRPDRPPTRNFQYEQHRQHLDRNRRNAITIYRHGRCVERDE